MTELMGDDACTRLAISPVRFHPILKALLLNLHRVIPPFEKLHHTNHQRLGMILFQNLIKRSYGGEVTFTIPTDMAQLKRMIDRDPRPAPAARQVRTPVQ